jgi:hypothetical protein
MHGLLSFSAHDVDELRAIVRDVKSLNDTAIAQHTDVTFFVPPAILTDTRIGSAVRTNLIGFKNVTFHDHARLKNAAPPPAPATPPAQSQELPLSA